MNRTPFNEVMNRVRNLVELFMIDSYREPNTVFLGQKEYAAIVLDARIHHNITGKPLKIFGMNIKRMDLTSYIAVGLLYEEEENE